MTVSISLCWRLVNTAIVAAVVLLGGAPADNAIASERPAVEAYCKRTSPPAFDCTCVGDRYETLSAQYPERNWNSLLPELMTPDCYSPQQIHSHYATIDCSRQNRTAERLRANYEGREIPSVVALRATIVDCECYASDMTDDILTLTVLSTRKIARFRTDAIRACPAD